MEHSGGSSSQHNPQRSLVGLGLVHRALDAIGRASDALVLCRGHYPSPLLQALEQKLNDHVYQVYKSKGEPILEILFFHGLQVGHSANAYRSASKSRDGQSQQLWLAPWLAEEFPDSCIFSM